MENKSVDIYKALFCDSENEKLSLAENYARGFHLYADPCHDFSHVERVLSVAMKLAKEENADLFIVAMSSLLHDIGRSKTCEIAATKDMKREAEPDKHEEYSVEMARPFLHSLNIDENCIEKILASILEHRHRRGRKPSSLEAKCLFDADKIDSLGAVGVARAYLWLGKFGRSVYYKPETWQNVESTNNETKNDSFQREWEIKLSGLASRMYTKTGSEIAKKRHDVMKRFLDDLESEMPK